MPCYIGDGIAICTGSGTQYLARTHWRGYQKWNVIGKPVRSYEVAARRMLKAFLENTGGWVNRADVIMTANYYDAVQVCELVRT